MKKMIACLGLLIILLSGCNMHFESEIGDGFELIYLEEWNSFFTIDHITHYIKYIIKYEWDIIEDFEIDHWQEPKYTLEIKQGDCDDSALVFIDMAYFVLGYKCAIVGIDTNDNQILENDNDNTTTETNINPTIANKGIIEGGYINHFVVYIPELNIYIDPKTGDKYDIHKIGYIYYFEELFPGN